MLDGWSQEARILLAEGTLLALLLGWVLVRLLRALGELVALLQEQRALVRHASLRLGVIHGVNEAAGHPLAPAAPGPFEAPAADALLDPRTEGRPRAPR